MATWFDEATRRAAFSQGGGTRVSMTYSQTLTAQKGYKPATTPTGPRVPPYSEAHPRLKGGKPKP
jgi:hypothetical protein